MELEDNSQNFPQTSSAKNTLAQAKNIVSPYFGVNDFAFAYARA